MKPKFKVGDVVCYKIGSEPYIVLNVFKKTNNDYYLYQVENENKKGYIGELCLKKYIKPKKNDLSSDWEPYWTNLSKNLRAKLNH